MFKIKITYSQFTPESATAGDFSETGWVNEEGLEFESVADAAEFLTREGATEASSSNFHKGLWYSTEFHIIDYTDLTKEEQNYHVYGATEAEELELYNRIIGRD